MTPNYQIFANGTDVTGRFEGRNVELTVVDATGVESDSAEITVADPNAEIDVESLRGAVLAILMGYGDDLVPMGQFKADEVSLEGYPHLVRITARSADNKSSLKERRIKDYTGKSFGEIVTEIAGRHGLTPRVAGALASIRFPTFSAEESYLGQHEESDPAFLTRVAERLGAFATIKQGNLIVVPKGEGESVSGTAGVIELRPEMLLDRNGYKVTWKDKPIHGKVEASYFDRGKVMREPVTAGSGDGVVYRFREPFPDKTQAQKAAEAKQRELARGEGSASFTCWGDPTMRAEMQVVPIGVRGGVDGAWTTVRVEQHMAGASAFTTKLEASTKPGAK